MISPSLIVRIRNAFPEPLRQALVAALDEAYQEVSAFHRPERGWNNFTFGTGVWTIAMFQLQELAREGSGSSWRRWTTTASRSSRTGFT